MVGSLENIANSLTSCELGNVGIFIFAAGVAHFQPPAQVDPNLKYPKHSVEMFAASNLYYYFFLLLPLFSRSPAESLYLVHALSQSLILFCILLQQSSRPLALCSVLLYGSLLSILAVCFIMVVLFHRGCVGGRLCVAAHVFCPASEWEWEWFWASRCHCFLYGFPLVCSRWRQSCSSIIGAHKCG